MIAETLQAPTQRRSFDDEVAEARLAKVRERIQKNMPSGRDPLKWRRASANRMESMCGRFSVEKSGDGEAARYTAKLMPNTVIGHRRYTPEQAKEDCNRHASPLALEPPQPAVIEREPGCDDE